MRSRRRCAYTESAFETRNVTQRVILLSPRTLLSARICARALARRRAKLQRKFTSATDASKRVRPRLALPRNEGVKGSSKQTVGGINISTLGERYPFERDPPKRNYVARADSNGASRDAMDENGDNPRASAAIASAPENNSRGATGDPFFAGGHDPRARSRPTR